MKQITALLLKAAVVLLAGTTLVYLAWFPQAEGRAVGLDAMHIYSDPFILYLFLASIPFFVILFRSFLLIDSVFKSTIQSQVTALNSIKLCSMIFIFMLTGALVYIHLFGHGDDPAGPTMLGSLIIVFFIGITSTAHFFQGKLR